MRPIIIAVSEHMELRCAKGAVTVALPGDEPYRNPPAEITLATLTDQLALIELHSSWGEEGESGSSHSATVVNAAALCGGRR